MGFGEEDHRGNLTFSSHPENRLSTQLLTVDTELERLAEAVLVWFIYHKVTPLPSFCDVLFVTVRSPHVMSGELHSTFLGVENTPKLFGILLHKRFVLSPHLFIYSIIYISMDSWIFILYPGLSFNTTFVFV